jgi:hypothetical protein
MDPEWLVRLISVVMATNREFLVNTNAGVDGKFPVPSVYRFEAQPSRYRWAGTHVSQQ